MRRVLLLSVLGVLAGALLVSQIERDAGYVYLSLNDTVVETSVWFAIVIWLLAWALLSVLLSVLRRLFLTHRTVRGWLGQRKSRNATTLTNRGLINFIEGNWERARKQLLRSARYSDAPLINHLMAARASFLLGDVAAATRQLGEAERVEAEAGIAVELTQAELQLSAGRFEQALATLVRARKNAGRHPHVLALLARAHRSLGDWNALRPLLPELHKHGVLETSELLGLEEQLWRELLAAACRGGDVAALKTLWKDMPATQREQPALRCCYVECLIEMGAFAEAEEALTRMLAKAWQPELVPLIGRFAPRNPARFLKTSEKWLSAQGNDPRLLLANARVALFAGATSRAEACLEEVRMRKPTTEVCLELGRLYASQGKMTEAGALFNEAAELSLGPLPVASGDPDGKAS